MRTADFNYDLPHELIAQRPSPQRDTSRLLVHHRQLGRIEHRTFRHIVDFLRSGDLLILNDSKVIPARLRGVNARTGGAFEMLLLEENAPNDWWAMMKPGKRARIGTQIEIRGLAEFNIKSTILDLNDYGHRRLRFSGVRNIQEVLDQIGEVPLPPYITRLNSAHESEDKNRYQTVFAETKGSVAAPTAGLHFTETLLEEIRGRGIEIHSVTLHVGLGTFAPVKAEALVEHKMHEERFAIPEATAQAVNEAKATGRRVVAVGTTSLRVLESSAGVQGNVRAGSGRTNIFIHPPYQFKIVDVLLTNFHLPCSTLLMLVSAFTSPGELGGRERILNVYTEAIRQRYRFFSYGDAMLIL